MNIARKLKIIALTALVAIAGMQAGEMLSVPGFHGLVTTAEAWVGRPLTPCSVAGVARRSYRRY